MTLRFPLRGPRLDLRPFTADDAAAAHRNVLSQADGDGIRHLGVTGVSRVLIRQRGR